jgi:monoamine oxidase
VVVAVPYHMLHAIQMEPSLTDDQWKAVDGLVAGMYTVVHLVMDVEANKFLMVDGKIPFPVLSRGPLGVIYGFLEKPAKDQKEEIFSLLIHGDYTRSYLEPQDKIRSRVLAGLDAIWPEFSKHLHGAYFYSYHPAATPGWPPGRSPIDTLHQSLKQENVGLFLAGDYIFSSHAEGAVMSGQLAAKKIGELLKRK